MKQKREKSDHLVRCISCKFFSYFPSNPECNNLHRLGFCKAESWDGNKSQWPMFLHPCKNMVPKEDEK